MKGRCSTYEIREKIIVIYCAQFTNNTVLAIFKKYADYKFKTYCLPTSMVMILGVFFVCFVFSPFDFIFDAYLSRNHFPHIYREIIFIYIYKNTAR